LERGRVDPDTKRKVIHEEVPKLLRTDAKTSFLHDSVLEDVPDDDLVAVLAVRPVDCERVSHVGELHGRDVVLGEQRTRVPRLFVTIFGRRRGQEDSVEVLCRFIVEAVEAEVYGETQLRVGEAHDSDESVNVGQRSDENLVFDGKRHF